jgi:hypothetical protein
MDQHYLVNYYSLQCGDRLVRGKGIFSKHHGIYVGYLNGIPTVAENQNGKGVQYVSLAEFLGSTNIERIQRFAGTEEARRNIIPRINNLLGTEYDLINFNCEHFAEWVQTGKSKSKQMNVVWTVLIILFVITGIGAVAAIASNRKR